jgi:hypothetical protein
MYIDFVIQVIGKDMCNTVYTVQQYYIYIHNVQRTHYHLNSISF